MTGKIALTKPAAGRLMRSGPGPACAFADPNSFFAASGEL